MAILVEQCFSIFLDWAHNSTYILARAHKILILHGMAFFSALECFIHTSVTGYYLGTPDAPFGVRF